MIRSRLTSVGGWGSGVGEWWRRRRHEYWFSVKTCNCNRVSLDKTRQNLLVRSKNSCPLQKKNNYLLLSLDMNKWNCHVTSWNPYRELSGCDDWCLFKHASKIQTNCNCCSSGLNVAFTCSKWGFLSTVRPEATSDCRHWQLRLNYHSQLWKLVFARHRWPLLSRKTQGKQLNWKRIHIQQKLMCRKSKT